MRAQRPGLGYVVPSASSLPQSHLALKALKDFLIGLVRRDHHMVDGDRPASCCGRHGVLLPFCLIYLTCRRTIDELLNIPDLSRTTKEVDEE